MQNLILIKFYNENNQVVSTDMVENWNTAQSTLAADLDGWIEELVYGTAELVVFLNIKQY